jgi:ribonuclease HI
MFPIIKNTIKIVSPSPKIYTEFHYRMNFDGCSKGNPGRAGAGAVLYYDDEEILCESLFIGEKTTNNHSEYSGLILGLQMAIDLNIKNLLVQGDSLLVINQMNNTYKCYSPNLIELHNKAKELEMKFDSILYQHVLRKFNKRADELSNMGLDKNTIII